MKIRDIRKKNGLTQNDVAKFLGISSRTYANYENEFTQPDINLLIKLSDFYNVSVDYLIGNELYNKPAGEFYQLTEKQKELIPYIKNLDDGTCMRVLGYLDKISQEQEDLNKRIN